MTATNWDKEAATEEAFKKAKNHVVLLLWGGYGVLQMGWSGFERRRDTSGKPMRYATREAAETAATVIITPYPRTMQ